MEPNTHHVYFAAVNVVSVGLLLSPHVEQSLSHMALCQRSLYSVTSGTGGLTGELLVLKQWCGFMRQQTIAVSGHLHEI